MNVVFQLTEQTIYVDSGMTFPLFQPLHEAVEVAAFDDMDVLLLIVAVAGSGSITVEISTGMQTATNDGWVPAGTFTLATAAGPQKLYVSGLLRYIRWRVVSMSLTNATFTLTGILRQRGAA